MIFLGRWLTGCRRARRTRRVQIPAFSFSVAGAGWYWLSRTRTRRTELSAVIMVVRHPGVFVFVVTDRVDPVDVIRTEVGDIRIACHLNNHRLEPLAVIHILDTLTNLIHPRSSSLSNRL